MVIFHGKLLNNQMVPFHDGDWYAKFGGSGAKKIWLMTSRLPLQPFKPTFLLLQCWCDGKITFQVLWQSFTLARSKPETPRINLHSWPGPITMWNTPKPSDLNLYVLLVLSNYAPKRCICNCVYIYMYIYIHVVIENFVAPKSNHLLALSHN